MAQQTNPALNSLIIYELSVMNLTEKHNFDGVIDELDRIRDLGVDVVWLMPIHPRGEKMKFGECGSPYSCGISARSTLLTATSIPLGGW